MFVTEKNGLDFTYEWSKFSCNVISSMKPFVTAMCLAPPQAEHKLAFSEIPHFFIEPVQCVAESPSPGARLPGFESCSTVSHWVSHLTTLCLSFLTCKIGMLMRLAAHMAAVKTS